MKTSLLSHIAGNFIREYENVANSSMAYILNTYPAARSALQHTLEIKGIPAYFETEYDTKGNGRPDIVGKNSQGEIVLIIEGKFWANLTDNQPVNYLKALQEDGKMVFLCPDRRIDSLSYEIQKRLDEPDDRLHILSWDEVIDSIERENAKDFNMQLSSDLMQMKDLCQKMDEEGMPPLSESDLSPMIGRVIYQFNDVIDECNRVIRGWDESYFKGLKTVATKEGYGFYFKAFGFGCRLVVSPYDWYTRPSQTPVWLYLWNENFEEDRTILLNLREFDSENTYEGEGNFILYAIALNTGMDKSQLIGHITEEVREVLVYLKSVSG